MAPPSAPLKRTSATTRTRPVSASRSPRPPRRLLAADDIVTSAQSGMRYRVARLLGEGGFGQVYLARRVGAVSGVPATICIKASERMDGWVR